MSSDLAQSLHSATTTNWTPAHAEAFRHGVVRHKDACLLAGPSTVRSRLRMQRWQIATAGVVVMHNGPLTDEQRLWVVLTAAPPGAVLGGLSAAEYDGLRGFRPDRLTIVLPGHSRGAPRCAGALPGDWDIAWRWSIELSGDDVNYGVVPTRTRLARSLLDAASERVAPRRSRVIIIAGVQQRRTAPAALWDALSRRGRCRNRRIIVESILDAQGGIQSLPEHEFDVIRRNLHLPEPARQQAFQGRDGRYFLDADWPQYGIRVEIHGIPHSLVQNWDSDLLRQNDITIDGGGLLIFSSYGIRHLQPVVGRQLLSMFRSRGWSG